MFVQSLTTILKEKSPGSLNNSNRLLCCVAGRENFLAISFYYNTSIR